MSVEVVMTALIWRPRLCFRIMLRRRVSVAWKAGWVKLAKVGPYTRWLYRLAMPEAKRRRMDWWSRWQWLLFVWPTLWYKINNWAIDRGYSERFLRHTVWDTSETQRGKP